MANAVVGLLLEGDVVGDLLGLADGLTVVVSAVGLNVVANVTRACSGTFQWEIDSGLMLGLQWE
jgi:hypothetical protein